jgi:hypothetical protein
VVVAGVSYRTGHVVEQFVWLLISNSCDPDVWDSVIVDVGTGECGVQWAYLS